MESPTTTKNNQFPHNLTIELCTEATTGRREFRQTVKDDLIIFNYDFCYGETFPNPNIAKNERERLLYQVRRECRGLIFNKETGRVVARRLHKFFNINESEETQAINIDFSFPHVLVEKVDGCLVSPVLTSNKIKLASKNGPTKFSDFIEESYIKKNPNMKFMEFFEEWMSKSFTCIFEWVSPEDPIVLTYEKDSLTLIAIRNNITGDYVKYQDMVEGANKFNIPVVKTWNGGKKIEDMQDFLNKIKEAKGIEGCVLRFDDGRMYKVKTEWYFSQSKSSLALPNQEREVWAMVLENKLDDLLPKLSIEVKNRLDDFTDKLFKEAEKLGKRMEQEVKSIQDQNPNIEKKKFVDIAKQKFPDFTFGIASKIFDKKDATKAAVDGMRGQCTSKSFEPMRTLLGISDLNFFKHSLSFSERD